MSVIRGFIAIDLSSEIRERIAQVSADLQNRGRNLPVRWVPIENIHLTLKFLGNVSEANLEIIEKVLVGLARNIQPCEVSVGGIGAFPKPHHPRIIWIGMVVPQEIMALQHSIELETIRLGYSREDRPFFPHLTIGRVSRNATAQEIRSVATVLENTKVGFLGATRVESIQLYRSELKPAGAVYSKLFTAPLLGVSTDDQG